MDTRCYGVYERTSEGVWLYPWGERVADAHDIRLRDVLRLGVVHGASRPDRRALVKVLREDPLLCLTAVAGEDVDLTTQRALDLVVGMGAPELHVRAMLTTADVATLIGVSRDTISAYRHRGDLPDPQAVVGRAPMWARPIIRHWHATRPGVGWRTDLYGDRAEHAEQVQHARAARLKRRRTTAD